MSQENVDLVRAIYADWERGEWGSDDWAHPEIEFVSVEGPISGTWIGLAAMAKVWREHLSAFADFRVDADEYRELGAERVLVLHTWSGRGKTSGLSVDQMQAKSATLFHIHDGKVTRLITYWTVARAFADTGLAE